MTLKFEVGKYYKDRAGRKHRVLATDLRGDYSIATAMERDDGVQVLLTFTPSGRRMKDPDIELGLDLVAEWVEPLTIEQWALVAVRCTSQGSNLYSRGCYVTYRNKEAAIDMLRDKDNPEDWTIVKLTGTLDPNQPEDVE